MLPHTKTSKQRMRCGVEMSGMALMLVEHCRMTCEPPCRSSKGEGEVGTPNSSKCKMLGRCRIGLACIRNTVGHHDAPTHKGRHATNWPCHGQLGQHPGYEGIGRISVEEFSGPNLLEGILAQGKWARPETPVTGQPVVVVGSEHVQHRLDAQGTPCGP